MEWTITLEGLSQFADRFWEAAGEAKVFAFEGGMGAGKTTIISALAKALGTTDLPASPTFSIINQYQYNESNVLRKFYHIDLYRLRSEEEVIQAGVEDCIYSGEICMVEWPQKAAGLFDARTVHVKVEALNDTERKVTLTPAAVGVKNNRNL